MVKYTKEEHAKYRPIYNDILDSLYNWKIIPHDIILGKIESAVAHGFPVNYIAKKSGFPLITVAAGQNLENIVMRLFELGADVNVIDRIYGQKNGILMYLINEPVFYSQKIFKELVARVENINYIDDMGHTILGISCARFIYNADKNNPRGDKFYGFIKTLLEAGADPDLDTDWKLKLPLDEDANFIRNELKKLIVDVKIRKDELQKESAPGYEYEI